MCFVKNRVKHNWVGKEQWKSSSISCYRFSTVQVIVAHKNVKRVAFSPIFTIIRMVKKMGGKVMYLKMNDNLYTFPYYCTFLLKRYLTGK